MLGSLTFQLCSLLYMIILFVVYFSKQRLNSFEHRIYRISIIVNFIAVIMDISSIFTIGMMDEMPLLNALVCKTYLASIVTWMVLLSVYIFVQSFKDEQKQEEVYAKNIKKVMIICGVIYAVLLILVYLLPLNYNDVPGKIYSFGVGASFVFSFSGVCIILWIIRIVWRFKYVQLNKCTPVICYVIFGGITAIVQSSNPEILLVSFFQTLVTFIMYFTIENPDMKLINQLNIARDQAEKANSAKTDFLSNMSHEIRTPLNAIVGFSQSLTEQELPDNIRSDVGDIMAASENLLDIVNGILDISKIEADKLEIVNTDYDIYKIVDEIVALGRGRLAEKPLQFRIEVDQSMPKVLYGDYTRVKQIVINILTNAIKYTKEGFVEFKVSSFTQGEVCRLIFSVEDSGIGIKKDKIDKLFNKFERVDLEENISIEGTGLGLAITKKLVELMKGKIVVQSIYGRGSKFTVAIDQKVSKTEIKETAVLEDEKVIAEGKKILLVDDNKVNLKVASRLLESYKVIVTEISGGEECYNKIKNGEQYDLILLDDMMPKLSGVETLKLLKDLENFETPTIALTANAISGMKEKYLGEGFDDYLAKPIDRGELNRVIKKYLCK